MDSDPRSQLPDVVIIINVGNQDDTSLNLGPSAWSVCLALLASLWNGIKYIVGMGVKALLAVARFIRCVCESIGKAVIAACVAARKGMRFTLEALKKGIETSMVLYARADSYFVPPENAWWVRFILDAKIPALKDAVKKDTGLLLRILWIVVFILGTVNASALSVEAYELYKKYPILFSFQPFRVNAAKIPVPSVAISLSKNLKTEMIDNTLMSFETGKRSANQEILLGGIYWTLQQLATLIHFLRSFCKPKLSWSSALEFSRFESPLDESKHEQHLESKEIKDDAKDPLIKHKIVPFLRKATTSCSEVIGYCSWNGAMQEDCSVLFQPTLTEGGVSCIFNKVPPRLLRVNASMETLFTSTNLTSEGEQRWKMWNLEKMSFESTGDSSLDLASSKVGQNAVYDPSRDIPLTQESVGNGAGLTIIVNTDESSMSCEQYDSPGLRLTLSFPLDDGNHEIESVIVPANHFLSIKVLPDLQMTKSEVRDVDKDKRECFFSNETVSLSYYKMYTQDNCRKECMAVFIKEAANCTLLTMPNSHEGRLCNEEEISKVLFPEAMNATVQHEKYKKCYSKCFPLCTSLSYRTRVTSIPLADHVTRTLRDSFDFDRPAVIHISNDDENVLAKVRTLRHSVSDILSLIGGLFGTILNMSGIDVARISFAIWFLLPSFIRIIWLIFNRLILWLFKLIFKCSRVVVGSPNNNVSSLATLAVSNETLEVSEESIDATVDEASSDTSQPPMEPVVCVESNNSTNESAIENHSAQNAVESVDASDSSEVILIVERQEHIEKIFSALFQK